MTLGDLFGQLRRAARVVVDVASRVGRLVAGAVVDVVRSRARLVTENVALRAQVATLKRKTGRVTPDPFDRVIFAGLWHVARDAVRGVLHAFRPETVIRWHQDVDRWLHAWHSRPRTPRTPPNRTPDTTRALVIDMAEKNPRWGAPRIVGELAKLEITLVLETVQRILRKRWPDGRPRPGQSWETFVKNHLPGTWACDFFYLECSVIQGCSSEEGEKAHLWASFGDAEPKALRINRPPFAGVFLACDDQALPSISQRIHEPRQWWGCGWRTVSRERPFTPTARMCGHSSKTASAVAPSPTMS